MNQQSERPPLTRVIDRLGAFLAQVDLLSLVFPPQCIACESYLSDEELEHAKLDGDQLSGKVFGGHNWCSECLAAITAPPSERCESCGAVTPVHLAYSGRCRLCYASKFHFDQAVCINNYGGLLQELVIRMKGQRDERLAIQLGNILGYHMHRLENIESVDTLAPVPTHRWKKFRTGFQASELICESASRITRIPRLDKLLYATRLTKKQGMLSTLQRRKNVTDAFAVNQFYAPRLKGLTVCLIDDVMTSGATVDQCAKVLKKAGAKSVVVAVVARGARSQ